MGLIPNLLIDPPPGWPSGSHLLIPRVTELACAELGRRHGARSGGPIKNAGSHLLF